MSVSPNTIGNFRQPACPLPYFTTRMGFFEPSLPTMLVCAGSGAAGSSSSSPAQGTQAGNPAPAPGKGNLQNPFKMFKGNYHS